MSDVSPDITVIGIELPDADALAIAEASLEELQRLMPDFEPRDGSPEVLTIGAIATTNAALVGEVQQIPSRFILSLGKLQGIDRNDGTAAAGVILVQLDAERTLTVPAGTQFGDPISGILTATIDDVAIIDADEILLPARATDTGTVAAALVAGTLLDIFDAIPGSVTATVATAFTGGTDPETDEQYFGRLSARQGRSHSSLVLPDDFKHFALEDRRVWRAVAIDNWNGADPEMIGDDKGSTTILVYGRGGEPVDGTVLVELETGMRAICASLIRPYVASAPVVAVPVSVAVKAMIEADHLTVQAAVEATIASWLHTDRWPFGRPVRPNELIEIVGAVVGVDYVDALTEPDDIVELTGIQLATAGAITVTVS